MSSGAAFGRRSSPPSGVAARGNQGERAAANACRLSAAARLRNAKRGNAQTRQPVKSAV